MRVPVVLSRIAASALAAALITLAMCGRGDAGPTETAGGIARLDVRPASVDLPAGGTSQLEATAYAGDGQPVTGAAIQWSTTNASVATVSSSGYVTALAVGSATITAATGGVVGHAAVNVMPAAPSGQLVEVYPGVTYQTITGWEATGQIGQVECNQTAYANYHAELLDRVVNELGINRLRMEVRSGMENPVDYWSQRWILHTITDAVWLPHRYEAINDNCDPFTANLSGFQLAQLDYGVDQIVTPMRALLAARGERLYVNLTYVDFGTSAFEQSTDPNEYAEFMYVIFTHLQNKYGWVPDAIEVSLEPDDNAYWRPRAMGPVIVATGDRLKAAGFRPAFIAPSTADAAHAVTYFDSLMQTPRVAEYLTDLSYHRYSGASAATIGQIGSRSRTYGVRTGMLEHIGSSYEDLQQDLEQGMVSEWQQYTLAACTSADPGGRYYPIDVTDPAHPVISMGSRTKFLRQYFLFVRAGAVRIGAASGDPRFDPVAFRNTNGKFIVVVKATAAGSFQVHGVPAGTYGIKYTTDAQYNIDLADVSIASGGAVATAIPASGVITIYQR